MCFFHYYSDSVFTAPEREKNLVDTRFFTPELCAARRPKAPLIPSEKTPPRISPRGRSGERHVGKSKGKEKTDYGIVSDQQPDRNLQK